MPDFDKCIRDALNGVRKFIQPGKELIYRIFAIGAYETNSDKIERI